MTTAETTTPLPRTHRTPPPPGLAPPPPTGLAPRTYTVGDRLTYTCTDLEPPLRLIGDVTASNSWLFTVRWAEGHGEARFAHGHEPEQLRRATTTDERDILTRATRHAVAHELRRLVDTHPHWPAQVRIGIGQRANDLTGGPR